jgi:uncharacterized membrane protein YeiH
VAAELLALAQDATSNQTIQDALGILQPIMEYAGTIAFAISGALVAGRKHMDIVGVVVLGTIVAVGGGTTRDLLLGEVPVFWINNPTFVIVGALTALATIPLFKTGTLAVMQRYNLIQLSDAAGVALFVVTGTNVALAAGADNLAAAIVGVIAGVGGGILRDLMANEVPDILTNGQFYASAAFAGAILYVLLLQLPVSPLVVVWIPIAVIFGIRSLSIIFGWGVPVFEIGEGNDPPPPST